MYKQLIINCDVHQSYNLVPGYKIHKTTKQAVYYTHTYTHTHTHTHTHTQTHTHTHTGVVAEHKSPIVSFHFLNEWGDLQAVPFKPHALSREGML